MSEKINDHYQGFLKAAEVEIGQRIFRRGETEKILEFIGEKPGKILEIGSNLSYLSKKINEKTGASVVGIDTNASGLVRKFAKRRTKDKDVDFVLGSGTEVPFADGSFDKVVLSHVLEHFSDQALILDEIRRVLKEKGELIVAVPKEKELGQFSKDHKQLFQSIDDLLQVLEKNNFNIIGSSEVDKSFVAKSEKAENKT